jgi:glutathione peroxidase
MIRSRGAVARVIFSNIRNQRMSIYDFEVKRSDGTPVSLREYDKRVLLIVNVASRCGFTPQYKGLQDLYARYHAVGLDVLGFPCDQFGHQEPGSDADIQAFCDTTYHVTFPVFAKIEVNGAGAHPLYGFLKQEKGGLLGSGIKWNFTKFLVSRSGAVIGRYPPTTAPDKLAAPIEAALAA